MGDLLKQMGEKKVHQGILGSYDRGRHKLRGDELLDNHRLPPLKEVGRKA